MNENASLVKYEPPKCDECGRKIVVLSDLCAKCAAGIELNGKEQANRPGTNPLLTWPKPPAPPNPPPAPAAAINEQMLEALKHAQKVLNHNNLALDCVPVNDAIRAAKAEKAKGGV